MIQIVNTWKSDTVKTVYFNIPEAKEVKRIGDYAVLKVGDRHYIYTYKGYAFNELCGLNIDHFNNVVNRIAPKVENQMHWLYFRAEQTLRKIEQLQKQAA